MTFELTNAQELKFLEWKKKLNKIPGAHYHFTFTPTVFDECIIKVTKDGTEEVLDLTDMTKFQSGTNVT